MWVAIARFFAAGSSSKLNGYNVHLLSKPLKFKYTWFIVGLCHLTYIQIHFQIRIINCVSCNSSNQHLPL